jgi:hypothetical protein
MKLCTSQAREALQAALVLADNAGTRAKLAKLRKLEVRAGLSAASLGVLE